MKNKTILSVLVVVGMSVFSTVPAQASETSGCFLHHIDEAIKLNKYRREIYSRLTGGKSDVVSDRLIFMENLSRPVAWFFDARARPFQKKGVPVMCDDFASMDLVGEFREKASRAPESLAQFKKQKPNGIRKRINRAWDLKGLEGVAEATEKELERLAATPSYHCLLRHFLESVLRAANMAPKYARSAQQGGLEDPVFLSREFIQLQLAALDYVVEVDRLAAPIQAEGIPIVCQDVPPIDPGK